jgi:hypothetical protein
LLNLHPRQRREVALEPIACRSTNRELGRRGKIGGHESGERNFFGRAWGGKRLKIGLREFPRIFVEYQFRSSTGARQPGPGTSVCGRH